jgi:tRNA pseudouridine55 synthase
MARRKKGLDISGWVALDKPEEVTSTQAVSAVQRVFNANKAGHAGTLDPLASGILPIALGEATKTVPWLVEAEKTYSFKVRWGVSTETQDREGKETASSDVRPNASQVAEALKPFIGEIDQVPPAYSAVKVDGERAYDLARAGETVELAKRKVVLHEAARSRAHRYAGPGSFCYPCPLREGLLYQGFGARPGGRARRGSARRAAAPALRGTVYRG